ncbi:NAD(P)-dependent oxidoreductase [Roseibium sp. SCPC15]|uniref:siroheme synthase family protein n=1 Tax=Roseibium sp. SCP15 TaxID=3141376 RepID=UPI00333DBC2C
MAKTLQEQADPKGHRHAKRIGALACLPLFFPLEGRKVVVIGGTEAAAWKAELLAASGAEVHVFASKLSLSFEELVAARGVRGRFILHKKVWVKNCFSDASLVVADANDDDEALAIWEAARAAGVPVNVIDKPAHCDFQFGSIVNRSPVVIGISTNGAAPILGQAIRRRIEALLPRGLKRWADLAGRIRHTVMKRLRAGQERRLFWEMFSDRALSGELARSTDVDEFASSLLAKTKAPRAGHVTLVGTGDGDADLLTLKAVRALQSADVILFDQSVSEEILELARREARRIPVETNSCRSGVSRLEVNKRVLSEVQQGKHVVWLKSGCLGTEREHFKQLEQSGFSVKVIPGVLPDQVGSREIVIGQVPATRYSMLDHFPEKRVGGSMEAPI